MTISDFNVTSTGDATQNQDSASHRQPADEAAASRTKLSLQATEPHISSPNPPNSGSSSQDDSHPWTVGRVAKDASEAVGALAVGALAFAGLVSAGYKVQRTFLPVAKPLEEFVAHSISKIEPSEWQLLTKAGVKTADPLRTLIQMPDYGGTTATARDMEAIIAGARDAVLTGKVKSAEHLENIISGRYLANFHSADSGLVILDDGQKIFTTSLRDTSKLRLRQGKHFAYTKATEPGWLGERSEAQLGGHTYHTLTLSKRFGALRVVLPKDKSFEVAAQKRTEELFQENIASRNLEQTPENLQKAVERAAELEWLNSRRWLYQRGTGGISQLGSRTWLEVAGIDSGRFKQGVDPNMQAIVTRSLDAYKQQYASLFETPPTYFSDSQK